MADDHFFTQLGMEFGPISLATIQEMVDKGGLAAGDQFREQGGSWRDVAVLMTKSASVPPQAALPRSLAAEQAPIDRRPSKSSVEPVGLKPESALTPEISRSTPQSPEGVSIPVAVSSRKMRQLFAECVSSQRTKTPQIAPVRVKPLGNRLVPAVFGFLKTALLSISVSIGGIFERIFWCLGFILRSRIALATIIGLLVAVLVSKVEISWVTQSHIHAEVKQIWSEYRTLRSQSVDKKTWTEFSERSEKQLAMLVPLLQKNARSSDPPSMALLRITKDYLPELLNDSTDSSAETEQKVEANLWVIDSAVKKPSESRMSWDLWSVSILVLDCLVVFGVLGFVGRKLWK